MWGERWHRWIVSSNLTRHRNGEFSYRGHWISVAWSHISANLLNKEKLIFCSIFLTFVIKALYSSCRWLARERWLGNAGDRPGIVCAARIRLINGYKDACFPFAALPAWIHIIDSCGHCLAAGMWWCSGAHTSGGQAESSAHVPQAQTEPGWQFTALWPWCRDIPQVEGRSCYSIASTFCFQTHHLFWLCPGEVFMCMNFSAITLALLFMSITSKEKKRKEMPSLQLFYQRMISVPSRLFSAFLIIICLQ